MHSREPYFEVEIDSEAKGDRVVKRTMWKPRSVKQLFFGGLIGVVLVLALMLPIWLLGWALYAL